MAEKTEKKNVDVDPQHIFVKAGKKDPTKVYVSVPWNYRDAQAEIKKLDAKFMGDNWEIDKEKFEAAEADIRKAAQGDIDMGKEARKEREAKLKAEKPKAEPKEKAPKEKAPKKELTEEEKAARAEAGRKAALERDAKRLPIFADGIEKGTKATVNGVAVTSGTPFELSEDAATDMNARFEGAEFKAGESVAYATFENADDKSKLSIADLSEGLREAAPEKDVEDTPAP